MLNSSFTKVFVFILNILLTSQLAAEQAAPKHISYLTSWGLDRNSSEQLQHSKVDAFFLAFAKWDRNGTITATDGMLNSPESIAYKTWTKLAHNRPNTEFYLSFGGQNFEDIWDQLSNDDIIANIANGIVSTLTKPYPVFEDDAQGRPIKIGSVQIDGIDLDFEQSSRLTLSQNRALKKLATQLRTRLERRKKIVLTTYHVGADPLLCLNNPSELVCSYRETPSSSHHGEVISLLRSSSSLFDFYNIMTYDAGRDFDYQQSLQNYAVYIKDKSKLRVGITINKQWSEDGGFVMPKSDNLKRACWAKDNGYGGFFVWALGANTESISLLRQTDYVNDLIQCHSLLEPIDQN
ncbi:MAG: glycosyl hydrolase family 18 protein [Gammaproteobacteria bacterium]|nr:glycosyl hydrolase family 18 protein [Gammaproteobacteria bacterium]